MAEPRARRARHAKPHLFGVRHHGPGSARAVAAALEATAPDIVLLEGPPEADLLLSFAADPAMTPPVALLAHAVDDPSQAGFWPYADFSPEWVAIRYALDKGVPVRFIDLPAGCAFALDRATRDAAAEPPTEPPPHPADEEPPVRSDPIALLARIAGHDDPERWWEDAVEHRAGHDDPLAPFALLAEAMTALRDGVAGGGGGASPAVDAGRGTAPENAADVASPSGDDTTAARRTVLSAPGGSAPGVDGSPADARDIPRAARGDGARALGAVGRLPSGLAHIASDPGGHAHTASDPGGHVPGADPAHGVPATAPDEADHSARPTLPDLESAREAHMRLAIATAHRQGFGTIAVVCGAWHVPALAETRPAAEDRAVLAPFAALARGGALPRVKVETTWVPWTYRRLAQASGYGAGIASPGWYHHLFAHRGADGGAPDGPGDGSPGHGDADRVAAPGNAAMGHIASTAIAEAAAPTAHTASVEHDGPTEHSASTDHTTPTTHPQRLLPHWFVRIADLFRDAGRPVSPAHVIEAVRHAEALAALRGRPLPGLDETLEAVRAIMCDGDDTPLRLVVDDIVVGDRIGTVPDAVPAVPLQRDLTREQRRLRLAPEAATRDLQLDLRKPTDADRSRLLTRLDLLGIPWGAPAPAAARGTGTFREAWSLTWQPELAIRVAEAGVWGTTVVSAATARAADLAGHAESLADVTAVAERCLRADLPAALPVVMRVLEERAALDSDVAGLAQALPALVRALRYGDVRGTDTTALASVVDGLLLRICVGLVPACAGLDDDGAREMRRRLDEVHDAAGLLAPGDGQDDLRAHWFAALARLADRADASGLLTGRAVRLLLDAGRLTADEAGPRLSRALTRGTPYRDAAAWIEGFLSGGGLLLVHDDALLALVDDWVARIPGEDFTDVLPLLRRTFSGFAAPERRTLGERLRNPGRTSTARPAEAFPFDHERADAALPLAAYLLGAPAAARTGGAA
ncbi:DUF5682 family protein [Yinghuangia sp. ASG 101]|uniref:DUF5682 family protein n=1 Tax=Yinghuangia sp. ASG 101 TaxID=2896848 RepID=UPI001E578918|nr:DUF5682 family protein [Yinghuangia sp. ASG 101]UGQ14542.1 DUF5682 family protein [Yinghuangia sp. ASG 101]